MTAIDDQARLIFIAALERSPDDWSAYLVEACGDNVELHARVSKLLAAHQTMGSIHGAGDGSFASTVDIESSVERPGSVIGDYRLLEQIGEGGFGVVFMAEQTQPVQRKVALKVLKPGMDTRQVVARFDVERQALAIMDHPNIAKVFDGGSTLASGRPYFVMELVKGMPITEFCDRNHLTTQQRLQLFIPVCQAVQHAHQKGIIHRDLKPSNVLVAVHDTTPVPKVIDFGIAKALGQTLTDKTLFTGFAQMIGTPLYMSPEQAGQSDLDIDTRSDIYSLGVLLYELLTGTTPFVRERFKKAAYDEICRIIREEDPPRPSTRLSESKESLPSISAHRHTEPTKLTKLVRGDLDLIVMKSLEKDRNRRYETANGFVADIQRYLSDEPVQACPPSTVYRLRKFARRNRGPVLAAVVGLLLLIGGTIGTTIGFLKASAERDQKELARQDAVTAAAAEKKAKEDEADQRAEAEAVIRYMVDALRKPDPAMDGAQLKVADLLEQAAARLDLEFAGSPKIKAALLSALGQTNVGLGLPAKAVPLFEKARALSSETRGINHPDTLTAMYSLAGALQAAGRRTDALALYQETLKRRKAALGSDDPATLVAMEGVARSLLLVGRREESVPMHEEAFARLKAKLGPDHPYTLGAMGNLGQAYQTTGRHSEALTIAEDILKLRQVKHPDQPETLAAMGNLAFAYQTVGRLDKALPLYETTLKLRKEKLGPNHSDTLASMMMLAGAFIATPRRTEAVSLYLDAIGRMEERLGVGHPRTLSAMNDLASAYVATGRVADAIPICDKTLALRKVGLGPEHPDTVSTMALLSFLLLKSKEYARAETVLRECLAIREKKYPGEWTTFSTRSMLGASLFGQKKYADAEPHLLQGYEGMKARESQIPAQAKPRLTEALQRLLQLYDEWGSKDKAIEWRKKMEAQK